MNRRPPILLSLALVVACLAPGAIFELYLANQGVSLLPPARFAAYMGGALAIVAPISYFFAPPLLRRCHLPRAAVKTRRASLHALQLVFAFVPPWQLAASFNAGDVPRVLLAGGGSAALLLIMDPIFRRLGSSVLGD